MESLLLFIILISGELGVTMDSALVWTTAVVVAAACGYFSYHTAARKGRNGLTFGLLGFFLPLIGVVIALALSPRTAKVGGAMPKESGMVARSSDADAADFGTTS